MTKLGPYELNQIYTGDARILSESIPDNSVDLIFTDPVYQNIDDYRWLAKTAARVLRPEGHLLAWQGVKWIPETTKVLGDFLEYRWTFELSHLNATVGTIKGDIYSHWTPCFWYSVNGGKPSKRIRDAMDISLISNITENHKWHKSSKALFYWMQAFTQPGDIVADFFCGGGTVPAVAKMLGINYWACEIDSVTADLARKRVEMTQPPLFVMQPEQLELI